MGSLTLPQQQQHTNTHSGTGISQLSFMQRLPYDVIAMVFSFISRADCMSCMCVCRSWYEAVPTYAESLWRQLSLQGSTDYMRRGVLLHKRFGIHVRLVRIVSSGRDGRLDVLLRTLLAKRCENIAAFVLERSYLPCAKAFCDWLQPFRQLTRLSLICLYLGGELPDLLATLVSKCPHLTHLVLQDVTAHKLTSYATPGQCIGDDDDLNNTSMTLLHISYRWRQCSFQHLVPALRRCPNLTYLSVAGEKDLDGAIFDHCPRLAYLDWMFFATRHKTAAWMHQDGAKNPVVGTGIQELSLFSYGRDIIDEMIRRRLILHTQRLALDDMGCDNDAANRLLHHCPSLRQVHLPDVRSTQLLDTLARQQGHLRELDMRVTGPAGKSSRLARLFNDMRAATSLHTVHLETDQPLLRDAVEAMARCHLRVVSLRPTLLEETDVLLLLRMVPLLESLRIERVRTSLSPAFFDVLASLEHLHTFHAAYTHLSAAGVCALADQKARTRFSLILSPFATDNPSCISYAQRKLKRGRFHYYLQQQR